MDPSQRQAGNNVRKYADQIMYHLLDNSNWDEGQGDTGAYPVSRKALAGLLQIPKGNVKKLKSDIDFLEEEGALTKIGGHSVALSELAWHVVDRGAAGTAGAAGGREGDDGTLCLAGDSLAGLTRLMNKIKNGWKNVVKPGTKQLLKDTQKFGKDIQAALTPVQRQGQPAKGIMLQPGLNEEQLKAQREHEEQLKAQREHEEQLKAQREQQKEHQEQQREPQRPGGEKTPEQTGGGSKAQQQIELVRRDARKKMKEITEEDKQKANQKGEDIFQKYEKRFESNQGKTEVISQIGPKNKNSLKFLATKLSQDKQWMIQNSSVPNAYVFLYRYGNKILQFLIDIPAEQDDANKVDFWKSLFSKVYKCWGASEGNGSVEDLEKDIVDFDNFVYVNESELLELSPEEEKVAKKQGEDIFSSLWKVTGQKIEYFKKEVLSTINAQDEASILLCKKSLQHTHDWMIRNNSRGRIGAPFVLMYFAKKNNDHKGKVFQFEIIVDGGENSFSDMDFWKSMFVQVHKQWRAWKFDLQELASMTATNLFRREEEYEKAPSIWDIEDDSRGAQKDIEQMPTTIANFSNIMRYSTSFEDENRTISLNSYLSTVMPPLEKWGGPKQPLWFIDGSKFENLSNSHEEQKDKGNVRETDVIPVYVVFEYNTTPSTAKANQFHWIRTQVKPRKKEGTATTAATGEDQVWHFLIPSLDRNDRPNGEKILKFLKTHNAVEFFSPCTKEKNETGDLQTCLLHQLFDAEFARLENGDLSTMMTQLSWFMANRLPAHTNFFPSFSNLAVLKSQERSENKQHVSLRLTKNRVVDNEEGFFCTGLICGLKRLPSKHIE
jgi:hypothetical protein